RSVLYSLSLHDALPILPCTDSFPPGRPIRRTDEVDHPHMADPAADRDDSGTGAGVLPALSLDEFCRCRRVHPGGPDRLAGWLGGDRKSTRLNSSHVKIS